jgi:hypothetical protein
MSTRAGNPRSPTATHALQGMQLGPLKRFVQVRTEVTDNQTFKARLFEDGLKRSDSH